jgi:hypothetical protein
MIGLETQQLLEHDEAQNLSVVDLGGRTTPRDQFAVPTGHSGLPQRIVQRRVDTNHQPFQIELLPNLRHGGSSYTGPHATYIDRIPAELESCQSLPPMETGATHR